MKQHPSSSRGSNSGVALIEALVGILIFAIGILGLVGLQASMTRAQTAAKFRGDAAFLSSEIIGTMWADRPNLASYATTPGSTCAYARCANLVNKITTSLPGGGLQVSAVAATGAVDITMTWTVSNEGTRTYALSTVIQ